MKIELKNVDCLTYMKSLPDKFFDVTIADPPYGIGRDWENAIGAQGRNIRIAAT